MAAPRLLLALVLATPLAACVGTDEPAGSGQCVGGKCDDPFPDGLRARALANLDRVRAEIDASHLANYGLAGTTADQFLRALELEYAGEPDQLAARMRALASMIFFAHPEVAPPDGGTLTPFHGLDMDGFAALMTIEDQVWDALVEQNGGRVEGVRPFSVCETRYLIDDFVRPKQPFVDFPTYRDGYAAFAATCPAADLRDWYNFRGLGGLRPSWAESNIMDRFLRRMLKKCAGPDAGWEKECARFAAGRRQYRIEKNRDLASRFLFFTADQAPTFADTSTEVALFEDQDGDGVGEYLTDGPATTTAGAAVDLDLQAVGTFSGVLKATSGGGAPKPIHAGDLVTQKAVLAGYDPGRIGDPDLGLLATFADPMGCGAAPTGESCPLLERFTVMLDRHEDFYQTYSALRPELSSVSSQPSPLVACSITLAAAHGWDSAGTPPGGQAGFIFLMRIPFADILAADETSIATLAPGPDVTSIADLYAGTPLDMGNVWLDIATLSHNQFSSEHEISKFGAVPAEQLEGILVVRTPAAEVTP